MDHKPAEGVAVEICSHPSTNQDDPISKPKRIRVRGRENRPTAVKNTASYCSLRQVDANGFIDFELLPSDAEITEYKIKVNPFLTPIVQNELTNNFSIVSLHQATISRTNRKKRTILPRIGLPMPRSDFIAETQFRIQSLYSPSNSFMVFVPPPHYPKAAVCLSVLPLKLYFTADRDINFNVHYMASLCIWKKPSQRGVDNPFLFILCVVGYGERRRDDDGRQTSQIPRGGQHRLESRRHITRPERRQRQPRSRFGLGCFAKAHR